VIGGQSLGASISGTNNNEFGGNNSAQSAISIAHHDTSKLQFTDYLHRLRDVPAGRIPENTSGA